ncbi:Na/Pi cotransporter family protein [Aureimonas phyllosphaerae]|uniref:Phosphate:Na+ symporter n=1 Tax=Aureimonas phyllosphaerae TaxID=1166078 RepID=A0A7W6BXE9_9HYPH|nr:Na/Pi cotransporter family protein [Aureimonas phyllosphaerae]MBB3938180.1 phosphate:Na+ symporter [Aureimonas phyllosphaerae]MBB3962194.1 phosphate:Na+ symporter [Aureimonas phyllosphaerae]SFF57498.1 phosphate:Na+ symporter [Aureimonas phyllosphaerae]
MSATQILISLSGQIGLLLYGIHMVTTGVRRALGSRLTRVLHIGLQNRGCALLTGIGVTALLQSSTATAMMVTAFTAGGVVDLMPGLAVMLGANIGTTLIVQLVSFDITGIFPALFLAGCLAYRSGRTSAVRDAGSALIGLGLILLALHLLIATMEPLEQSQALSDLLRSVTADPLLTMLLAAGLAWAAHSSVAAMLFIMSLAGTGVIAPEAALTMVLGANLGSAFNPLISSLGDDPVRMQLPLGNLINRLVGCALALPFLGPLSEAMLSLDASPAHAAANFHVAFNVGMGLIFIALLPQMAHWLENLFPARAAARDPGAPRYLDEAAVSIPSVALANAGRETLRMADVIDQMLRASQQAFHEDDHEKIAATRKMDDILDRLFAAIQNYLGLIGREPLGDADARRLSDTLALAINLEHIGDIIDRSLMDNAAKRIRSGIELPEDARRQIDDMHTRLLDHLQLAVAVFMSGDVEAAHRLVVEKEGFRELERATTQRHVIHMRGGRRERIDASSMQLDIMRDLKRIESHIAATAYGLLELSGDLRSSRLQPRA